MGNSEALSALMFNKEFLDKLPRGWRYLRIKDLEDEGIISDIQDGNHGELHPKSSDYVSSGIPFIMAKDLVNGRLNLDECKFISRNQAEHLRIGFARPGDVLLTHKATMGRVAIVPNTYDYIMLTPQVTYYRIGNKEKLDNAFLKYAFLSPNFQHQLNSNSDQSTRKFIGITAQRDLWLLLPPISEQRIIAGILSNLDNKIELNRKINETLEAIARTIYKSWFIDFNPVEANMEGHQSFGIDAEMAALFPDTFEDSQLGRIPKGWSVKPLSECVIYLSRGVAPKYLQLSPIRVLNQRAIRWWDIDEEALKFHDPGKSVRKEAYIRKGDVVINSTGDITIGRAYWFYHEVSDLFADSHVSIIRTSLNVLLPEMIVFQVERPTYQDIIYSHVTGSTGQLELNRSNLAQLPFLCPPIELQRKFSAIIEPFFRMIWDNKEQTDALTSIRDALLPKLLSGEIRVKDAEKYTEAIL